MKKVKNPNTVLDHLNNHMVDSYLNENKTETRRLEKGMTVTVYDDPHTERKPLGRATLVEFIGSATLNDTEWTEQWYMNFNGEETPMTIKCK